MNEAGSADPPPRHPEDPPAKGTLNTAAVPTDLTPGECREYPEVPGYEILGICGHGGMGVVYRTRQIGANRLVALKMIRAVELASPQDRVRFQIETEAVAHLQHPHIVQLYEVGEVRGQPFFSLEFCDGGTLAERLKKQRSSAMPGAVAVALGSRALGVGDARTDWDFGRGGGEGGAGDSASLPDPSRSALVAVGGVLRWSAVVLRRAAVKPARAGWGAGSSGNGSS